jgi:tetratricopeptide (TPR) repeat protein
VIRINQDFAGAGHEQPLDWLDALASSVDLDQLMMIANELPQASLALLVHSTKITATVVEILRAKVEAGESHRLPDLASALNNLATRLSNVGQREAALAAAKEAADIYRELAARAPDAYRPDLAMVLNDLANRLSEVGQREAALAPAQEAVAIRRELAARAPDAYRPALAGALAALANQFEENGQIEAAFEQNREAIEIYAPFFLAQPKAFVHWMLPMCRQYIERCEKLGREPDGELLGPIVEVLQRMQESPPDEAGQ